MNPPSTSGKAPAAALTKSWLINPAMDFSFFIAAPLLIVPAFHILLGFVSLTAFKLGVLSISATGHHLPGFIRAYTDSAVFRQFKIRLLLVPFLLILFAVIGAYYKLSLIFLVLMVWSTWHGGMQIHGFLRIYDAKARFNSMMTARLDFWMCLAWFVQVVLWSPSRKASVLSTFYLSGGPLIPVDLARIIEFGWLALTVTVTAAFLFQTASNRLRHGYFNVPKILCMAFSIGFWGYCMIGVENLIIGLILWEIFHDLQYNVFVWNYNRGRVRNGLSGSGIEKFLFQMNWGRLSLYALCIAAYGSIGLLSQDLFSAYENGQTYRNALYQIGNVFAASALIHFYMDGFIWKVRDGKVQADLGVAGASSGFRAESAPFGRGSGLRHWAFVAVFFAGAGGLGASEYFHKQASGGDYRTDNLADLVPESGYANFIKAGRLHAQGHSDSAALYYSRAIRFDPNYRFSHMFIAEIKKGAGEADSAIYHYEKALEADSGDEEIRANLAEMYMRARRYGHAEPHYRALAHRYGENAEYSYQVAWALLQMRKGMQAKPFLERTLELEPGRAEVWNYLGMVEQASGNEDAARRFYLKSLELDPEYAHARQNLAAIPPLAVEE